jgi:hypothetical protein
MLTVHDENMALNSWKSIQPLRFLTRKIIFAKHLLLVVLLLVMIDASPGRAQQ